MMKLAPPMLSFNPPSPCGEGLPAVRDGPTAKPRFNPPSPCGEGPATNIVATRPGCVSIHPPRVGRDASQAASAQRAAVSIHPPRVGRDPFPVPVQKWVWGFQSTLPVWGGTPNIPAVLGGTVVFQSTLPVWGGTRLVFRGEIRPDGFQSTLPVWGGTMSPFTAKPPVSVSIHPPRVGRDPLTSRASTATAVSIHPPRVGRDQLFLSFLGNTLVSIHPPRVGRD